MTETTTLLIASICHTLNSLIDYLDPVYQFCYLDAKVSKANYTYIDLIFNDAAMIKMLLQIGLLKFINLLENNVSSPMSVLMVINLIPMTIYVSLK